MVGENVNSIENHARRAGFWIRVGAFCIDLIVVGVPVWFVAYGLSLIGVYIPFELTAISILFVYSVIGLGRYGCTVGKKVCALRVLSRRGRSIGYIRSLLRESVGKIISSQLFAFGFLWVGITGKKRGWHDYLIGTVVEQDVGGIRRGRWITMGVLGLILVMLTVMFVPGVVQYYDAMTLHPQGEHVTRLHPPRDGVMPVEAGQLTPDDKAELEEWLKSHGEDPIDYAVRMVTNHQVTLFGEGHGVKENLQLLNRMIPELYHRAGVTCLAMEVIRAEDNDAVNRLVSSEVFDAALSMKIARHSPWECWGMKEYWDVLHTVWELNQTRNPGQRTMRVVGISPTWDGPSFGLVKHNGDYIPAWEKLRIPRLATTIVSLLAVDEIYARNVEKEIIEKGERGIVLVGAAHAPIRVPFAAVKPRMGYMLHRKYGGSICHVLLHNIYGGDVSSTIDTIATASESTAMAFDLADSPFGRLRDSNMYYYRGRPDVCLRDLADGYIILGPVSTLHPCEWTDGFITTEMFGRNKPFYETMVDRKLANADEANAAFATGNIRSID